MRQTVSRLREGPRAARKTLVEALPSSNKAVLHSIKLAFAFSWAFVNSICVVLASRFFTMHTGNVLILAVETLQWKTEEMAFTATLIFLYIGGGAAYDGCSFWLKNDEKVVKRFVVPSSIVLGIVSDVTQFVTGSCSSGDTANTCSGKDLYFLTPMAVLTGIVTSYLTAHPDGIITHLITTHMKVLPKAVLQRVLQGKQGVWEKAFVSTLVTTFSFLGALLGAVASKHLLERHSMGVFTPLFTSFSVVMATLTYLHFTLCEQFCYNKQLENKMIEKMRATMQANGVDRRTKVNVIAVQRMMMNAVQEVDDEDDDSEDEKNDNEAAVAAEGGQAFAIKKSFVSRAA